MVLVTVRAAENNIILKKVIVDKGITQYEARAFPDTLAAMRSVNAQVLEQRKNGFLTANIDSLRYIKDTLSVFIFQGPQYKFGKIGLDSIPKGLLDQLGISALQYEGRSLEPAKLTQLMEKILVYAENNGHPFASVSLANARLADNDATLYADLVYLPGNLVRIDSIQIRGPAEVNYKFILAYLGLKNKQLYNESAITSISKKLRELAFVKEAAPWKMDFTVYKNDLYIYLEEKRSNQVNALLGFQPNDLETGRFLWTADVQLLLNNTLGYGETFSASYKNLQRNSPQLDVATVIPYLSGSNFAVDAKFEYFRRDSLFDRISFEGGLRYQLSERDHVRLSFQQINNRVPSPDTNFVRNNKRLGNNVDIRSRGVGFGYVMDRTDYTLNPRKGWSATMQLSVLKRMVQQNNAILAINDGFDYGTLYDTINDKPTQYRLTGSMQYFIPIARQLAVRLAYEGAYIGGNDLYQNELYQIGGFKVLRGYDERSIFSDHFHIGTLEFRSLLGRGSYFNIFSDYGKVFTRYDLVDMNWNAWSIGTGLTLENKTGIFNIILALGKFENEPFRFRDAKVHFGYVTYF